MREYTASGARERFAEILHTVEQGTAVAITKHGKAIAKITRLSHEGIPAPGWGAEEGWSIRMADDFKRVPEAFEDYT